MKKFFILMIILVFATVLASCSDGGQSEQLSVDNGSTTTDNGGTTTDDGSTDTDSGKNIQPIIVEAEDYNAMSGVDTQDCSEGGKNVGWIDSGDWMDYVVDIPVSGTYAFTVRVASNPGDANLQVQVNGSSLGNIAFDTTGGWQVWTSHSTTIQLAQGTQTIRLYAETGGWNINWFQIGTGDGNSQDVVIPLHIEYAQYLRLGFSPADQNDLSELITQNTDREAALVYPNGTTFTISLTEKRRAEDVRFYTFKNGSKSEIIQGVPLTVTAYPGMEIYIDFIEDGSGPTAPIASAGDNQVIDLAQNTCTSLNGSASIDPDGGSINSYAWSQLEGPNQASIDAPGNGMVADICNLIEGRYRFQLSVVDDEGETGTDSVQITVIHETADFTLQGPSNGSMITDTRRPQFTWNNVDGAIRYEVYVNVTKDNYDWYKSGNLLDRYTVVGESTTNSFAMPYDLVDRWTYKWYVLAFDGSGNMQVSNTQQFGVYLPTLEQEDDGINIVNGCRDLNKNNTIEPFEDWHLTPDQRLDDLMARLPLEEKFKQLYYGGGDDPGNGFAFSYGVDQIMRNEQYAAAATPWGIPIAHAGDKIHGWKTIYPTQLGLAATRDPNIAYQCGNMQRVEHKSGGFAGSLSPLAEVDTKVLYPRFQEGNGENADEAAAIVRALVCGMQGGPEINPHSMLVTVKHWPGQGAGGEGPTQYDERTIGYHMKPWYAMVDANAASVMPGYSSSPLLDPTGAGSNTSKPIIDYLRDVIGFNGFVVTDWLAANTDQSIKSIGAGADVLGGATSSGTDMNALVAAIGVDRLNEACRRVLNMKIRLGMFENPYGDPTAQWTNAEHHAIALNAARKSITLIKNNGVLPIVPGTVSQIGVAGPRATWENKDKDPNVIWQSIYYDNPQAMNYLQAFTSRASGNGISVVGGQGTSPDVAVVVIGEEGYTHGTQWADKNPNIPDDQLNAIRDFSNRGIPVITVVITPRPYVLTEVVNISSAVMLVYRGGNGIAQATAELCFGDYNPTGKLPFQLPRSQDQIGTDNLNNQIEHWELPYDIGATDAERDEIIGLMENDLPIPPTFGDPLFQYGYGIQDIHTIE